jgi:hypothetical protein
VVFSLAFSPTVRLAISEVITLLAVMRLFVVLLPGRPLRASTESS